MKKIKYIFVLSTAFLTFSCSSNDKAKNDGGTKTDPVEKEKPNSNYKPAFAGQTRVNGMTTNT
ncbi:MAG: PQQ-dependent sugar dehydrogenase, partial [Flavobacterium sp.]